MSEARQPAWQEGEGMWQVENLPVYLLSTLEARLPGSLLPSVATAASTDVKRLRGGVVGGRETGRLRQSRMLFSHGLLCCVYFKLSTQQSRLDWEKREMFICWICWMLASHWRKPSTKSSPLSAALKWINNKQQRLQKHWSKPMLALSVFQAILFIAYTCTVSNILLPTH